MTENLGTISRDHWHLDLTKAEWLLSSCTGKIKQFTTEYPQPVLRILVMRPLPQKGTHRLCWNIKTIQCKQRGKNYLCLFQCNLISIPCVSVFLAQLCKINFFFKSVKNLWGTDPKVRRFGDKSALLLFWKTTMENIWKCIKDNI